MAARNEVNKPNRLLVKKQSKRFLFLQKKLKEIYKELNDIASNARANGCEHIVEEHFRAWDSGYGRQEKVAYKYCPVCGMELHYDSDGKLLYTYE